MFLTFPVLGNSGLSTIETRIWLEDNLLPNCKDCGQTMNEIYIVGACERVSAVIHIHLSHRHYDTNRDYRTHYCCFGNYWYEFPKSH